MKKLLIVAALAFAVSTAHAQVAPPYPLVYAPSGYLVNPCVWPYNHVPPYNHPSAYCGLPASAPPPPPPYLGPVPPPAPLAD